MSLLARSCLPDAASRFLLFFDWPAVLVCCRGTRNCIQAVEICTGDSGEVHMYLLCDDVVY